MAREADRWFCSFTVEVEREPQPNSHQDVLGVDLGLNRLATFSVGSAVESPRPLRRRLRKLRRLSRAHSRKQKGSRNRRRSARRLARLHAKIGHQRGDFLHQHPTRLARSHGTLVVEDLNVRAMLGNRRLARAIADSGWAEFILQLRYKCEWCGSRRLTAPRFLASSKTCSGCGVRKAKLELWERIYRCPDCGLGIDRDLNAARNLRRWGEQMLDPLAIPISDIDTVAGCASEALNAVEASVRPRLRLRRLPVKQEPSGHEM